MRTPPHPRHCSRAPHVESGSFFPSKYKKGTHMNSIRTQHILASLIAAVGLAANGQCQSFLTEGLVAYYPFNGNANDASGNGYNASVQGNYEYLSDGTLHLIGDGQLFYSGGGYVALPDYGNLNSGFTMSIWVGGETDHGTSIYGEMYLYWTVTGSRLVDASLRQAPSGSLEPGLGEADGEADPLIG